jgi:hypothetical protein
LDDFRILEQADHRSQNLPLINLNRAKKSSSCVMVN